MEAYVFQFCTNLAMTNTDMKPLLNDGFLYTLWKQSW